MSKSLQSPSLVRNLHVVCDRLNNSRGKTTRARIDEWLDEHPETWDNLWQFMESDLLIEMVNKDTLRRLPRSCTRLALVPDTIRRRVLTKANPTLTTGVFKAAHTKDHKSKEKLFLFGLNLSNGMPVKGHIPENVFMTACEHRVQVCGSRLKTIEVAGDGMIDWMRHGVYVFAKATEAAQRQAQYEILHDADKVAATHIVHRFAHHMMSLESLGCGKVGEGWSITKNWSEREAQLFNGKRLKIDLWDDVKDLPWFDFDGRLKSQHPNTPFFDWFGDAARQRSKADVKMAADAAEAAKRAAKDAGLPTINAPLKKRRRV